MCFPSELVCSRSALRAVERGERAETCLPNTPRNVLEWVSSLRSNHNLYERHNSSGRYGAAMAATDTQDTVRIGRVPIPVATAVRWIEEYTDAASNRASERPYAFPAYDRYDGGTADPGTLTDGDLLAPVLLNVQVKIRTYYGLQAIRDRLQEGLRDPVLAQDLACADPQQMATAVRALYGVLDEKSPPWGVPGTTLSKVLHRKRPKIAGPARHMGVELLRRGRCASAARKRFVGRLHGPGDRSDPSRHRGANGCLPSVAWLHAGAP